MTVDPARPEPTPTQSLLEALARTMTEARLDPAQVALFEAFAKTLQRSVERLEFMANRAAKDKSIAINLLGQTVEGLRLRSEELEANERRLAESVAHLKLVNEDMQHFMHVASHDLKTPLRSIGSFANLIERRHLAHLSEDAADYFGYIKQNAANMNRVIDDLVAYNRAGGHAVTVAVDLDALLAQVELALFADLEESGCRLEKGALGCLDASESGLRQLLQNLIRNAIVYRDTTRLCRIRVHVERPPGAAPTLVVADTGLGLDTCFAGKVFNPFQRVGDLSRPGTGMGLAICRRIVREGGGEIHYLGEVGVGTTFYVGIGGAPAMPETYRASYS